jgi:hypothetical protein
MGPIRDIPLDEIVSFDRDKMRAVNAADFEYAMTQVRASVSPCDLEGYVKWNAAFGSLGLKT